MNISDFKELALLFEENGFDLYLVGGSVRDYLLHSSFLDADCVSNASLNDIKKFLFIKSEYKNMESGKFVFKGKEFDITSMRKESGYTDFRHPSLIEKANSPKEDYSRRDFTINALYMDKNEKIYDYSSGISDLKEGLIRCIGDPYIRLKEDSLRILRAIRFSSTLNFKIEPNLKKAIIENKYLLQNLKYVKIKEEIKKFKIKKEELINLLTSYDLNKVIPLNFDKVITKSISYINYNSDFVCILNDIVSNESFVNIIKIKDELEITNLLKGIEKYKSFVNFIQKDTKFDNLYSQGIYLLIVETDDEKLLAKYKEILFILNSSNLSDNYITKIKDELIYKNKKTRLLIKDNKFFEFTNKKQRNKLYYESFIKLLKD